MMNEWIVSSSLLIAGILAVRLLLRGRIRLRLQYALWGVVLLRLLLPVQLFTSEYGAGAFARDVNLSEPVRQAYFSANEDRYDREYGEAVRQVAAQYVGVSEFVELEVIEREAQNLANRSLELDLTQLLMLLWLGGMVTMTSVIAFCNVHLGLRLKRSRRPMEIPDSLLPVYITAAVPTPCIFGLFRPAVYLTPAAAENPTVLRHALTHELTHYRHFDHLWSVLRSICLVLHWYNPLVWIAARISRADAELACDEGALAQLGEVHRADYGRTLIGLTCADRGSIFVTATTMTGSAGSIRERIRLLMKRPRNTIVTLTALILLVTMIVGCAFAGAPETGDPTDSEARFDVSGLLVFPGTEWGMTEAEVLKMLNLQETDPQYGLLSGPKGFLWLDTDFCGFPATIAFYFDRYRSEYEWGLSSVRVQLQNEDDANAVYNILYEKLGSFNRQASVSAYTAWYSDAKLEDLISPEAWAIYQNAHTTYLYDGQSEDLIAASAIAWFGKGIQGQENMICFSSGLALAQQIQAALAPSQETTPSVDNDMSYKGQELPIPEEPGQHTDHTEEVRSLLGKNGDPDNLAALTRLWSGYFGIRERKCIEPFIPEIVDCVQTDTDTILVDYRRPGWAQLYQAELAPHSDSWAVINNVLVLSMADYADKNPRALNEKELNAFRDAFSIQLDDGSVNPAACFLLPYYSEIYEMDGGEFLVYFPTELDCEQEDFDLLKAKYPDYFHDWTWETMPLPIHRYDPADIENVLTRYGNIHWEELDDNVHYLEETGCYYNYTSDFGLGGFYARGGFVYEGGAVVYSDFSALFFTETMGHYTIRAHLPAIIK